MSFGGALGAPSTAFQYDFNILPVGQRRLDVTKLQRSKEFHRSIHGLGFPGSAVLD
jgi:hypothetical protein